MGTKRIYINLSRRHRSYLPPWIRDLRQVPSRQVTIVPSITDMHIPITNLASPPTMKDAIQVPKGVTQTTIIVLVPTNLTQKQPHHTQVTPSQSPSRLHPVNTHPTQLLPRIHTSTLLPDAHQHPSPLALVLARLNSIPPAGTASLRPIPFHPCNSLPPTQQETCTIQIACRTSVTAVTMSNSQMEWTSWANSSSLHPLTSHFLNLNKVGERIILRGRDTRGLIMRDTVDKDKRLHTLEIRVMASWIWRWVGAIIWIWIL